MKTVCIKTNNSKAINYLLEKLKNIKLDDVYFSCYKFKIYNNIFIHYKGSDLNYFLSHVSTILSCLVLENFEDTILKKILYHEYFYFDAIEKNQILNNIQNNIIDIVEDRESLLFHSFYNFLENNNKLYLKGFITFRLKNYINELSKIIDNAINEYLIEKEYTEFVSLLKVYVNSEPSKCDFVHLIYHNEKPILLDSNKNIIKTELNLMNAKYLSDISFSSSDMVLNTLLSILPRKIYIHLIDEADEFISTLQLIFENKIFICKECNICNVYRNNLKHRL